MALLEHIGNVVEGAGNVLGGVTKGATTAVSKGANNVMGGVTIKF